MKSPSVAFRFAAIAMALLMSACTTTTTQSFNVTKNPRVEASVIAVDADFGRYDRILANDMGIFFPEDAAPSVADQERTRQIFRTAFLGELVDHAVGHVSHDADMSLIPFGRQRPFVNDPIGRTVKYNDEAGSVFPSREASLPNNPYRVVGDRSHPAHERP